MPTEIKLLDHGFIRLVEHWGQGDAHVAEAGIIEAARMSTQKGFQGWGRSPRVEGEFVDPDDIIPSSLIADPDRHVVVRGPHTGKVVEWKDGDEKLLRYLYEHAHSTPFEFAGAIIEVQAPIFVFREWHRHRVQSYNEMSARYSPIPDVNYVPTVERLMMQSKKNKQAGAIAGAEDLTEPNALIAQALIKEKYTGCEHNYQTMLSMGVPKELARIILPVGRYSRMRASACLRNWLSFMTLRSAPTAQWEIQQYSNALGTILTELFPRTMSLFKEKRT